MTVAVSGSGAASGAGTMRGKCARFSKAWFKLIIKSKMPSLQMYIFSILYLSPRIDSGRMGRDAGRRDRPSSRHDDEDLDRDRRKSEWENLISSAL